MFSIAIVDDDITLCSTIDEYLKRKLYYMQLEVSDFSNGEEFIKSINEGKQYDMVFMDVYMEPMNGYETGVLLRQNKANADTVLIYVSSRTDNLIPFFALHPFDYIEKPLSYPSFSHIMDRVLASINKKSSIVVKSNSKEIIVNTEHIIYATICGTHKVRIVLKYREDIVLYGKLSDLHQQISGVSDSFVQIHKSYIVNLKYVKTLSKTEMELIGCDDILPISQAYRKTISAVYYEFIQDFVLP